MTAISSLHASNLYDHKLQTIDGEDTTLSEHKGKVILLVNVASRCCYLYWANGVLNVSYNDAIKHAKVSKSTVYKLFKSEDELQKETLAYYDEVYINKLETAASL